MKLKFKPAKLTFGYSETAIDGIHIIFAFSEDVLNCYNKITKNQVNLYEDLTPSGAITLQGEHILASLGEKSKFTRTSFAEVAAKLAKFVASRKITTINLEFNEEISVSLSLELSQVVEQFLVDFGNSIYCFDSFKSIKHPPMLATVNVVSKYNLKPVINNVIAILTGYYQVRDLANNPPNIATPSFLAETALSLNKISDKVKVTVLDKKAITKLKMNAFLGVAKGSVEEPKFIIMEYSGGEKNTRPVMLVGKGITFDSGGISLKPRANLDDMKYDMCGAATVIGVFAAVARLSLPVNLVVLVPTCENMPSGTAQRPGDIVTTMAGKTVEILNTDAEGRLILCDALHYAKLYNPEFVIDVATLTGACVVALGSVASGLYVNDEELYAKIHDASLRTSEKVWRMPLFEEYKAQIKGTHADLLNIGGWDGKAGSITAASFLEEFVTYKWAHLDIAGVAYANDVKGGTGRPFKLLLELIRSHC